MRSRRQAVALVVICWAAFATPGRVIDGDTFEAEVRVWPGLTARETVRVLGVDTPERKGETRELGEAARVYTSEWIHGQELRLHACTRDAFGRLLATVTRRSDGANLTTDLLTSGNGKKR